MNRNEGNRNNPRHHYDGRGRNVDSRSHQRPRRGSSRWEIQSTPHQPHFWQDTYNVNDNQFAYHSMIPTSILQHRPPLFQEHSSFNQFWVPPTQNFPMSPPNQPWWPNSNNNFQLPHIGHRPSAPTSTSNIGLNSNKSLAILKTQSVAPSQQANLSDAVNPPLGSKEAREKRLEESRNMLVKSLNESKVASDSKFDKPKTLSEKSITKPDSLGKFSLNPQINAGSSKQTDFSNPSGQHQRRSSLETNNQVTSSATGKIQKTPAITVVSSRRKRSTSCSSNSFKKVDVIPAPVRTKQCQSNKLTENIKQLVLQQLLSMSKNKLKEIVSNPRSRKFEFVMKYMIKERRSQQAQKQRQLAEAGILGTNVENNGELLQVDYESLLSDPDLAVNLSNLPPEMIETLGTVFNLNSTGSNEPVTDPSDLMEVPDSMDLNDDLDLPYSIDLSDSNDVMILDNIDYPFDTKDTDIGSTTPGLQMAIDKLIFDRTSSTDVENLLSSEKLDKCFEISTNLEGNTPDINQENSVNFNNLEEKMTLTENSCAPVAINHNKSEAILTQPSIPTIALKSVLELQAPSIDTDHFAEDISPIESVILPSENIDSMVEASDKLMSAPENVNIELTDFNPATAQYVIAPTNENFCSSNENFGEVSSLCITEKINGKDKLISDNKSSFCLNSNEELSSNDTDNIIDECCDPITSIPDSPGRDSSKTLDQELPSVGRVIDNNVVPADNMCCKGNLMTIVKIESEFIEPESINYNNDMRLQLTSVLHESLNLLGTTAKEAKALVKNMHNTRNEFVNLMPELNEPAGLLQPPVPFHLVDGVQITDDSTVRDHQSVMTTDISSSPQNAESEQNISAQLNCEKIASLENSEGSSCVNFPRVEVSTQTEILRTDESTIFNTTSDFMKMLSQMKNSCTNQSVIPAIQELQQYFGFSTSAPLHLCSPEIASNTTNTSKGRSKIQTVSCSVQTNTDVSSDCSLMVTMPRVTDNLFSPTLIPSIDVVRTHDGPFSLEKLKSLFIKVTEIENNIELLMKTKKAMYNQILHLLKCNQSEAASASKQANDDGRVDKELLIEHSDVAEISPRILDSRKRKSLKVGKRANNTKNSQKSSKTTPKKASGLLNTEPEQAVDLVIGTALHKKSAKLNVVEVKEHNDPTVQVVLTPQKSKYSKLPISEVTETIIPTRRTSAKLETVAIKEVENPFTGAADIGKNIISDPGSTNVEISNSIVTLDKKKSKRKALYGPKSRKRKSFATKTLSASPKSITVALSVDKEISSEQIKQVSTKVSISKRSQCPPEDPIPLTRRTRQSSASTSNEIVSGSPARKTKAELKQMIFDISIVKQEQLLDMISDQIVVPLTKKNKTQPASEKISEELIIECRKSRSRHSSDTTYETESRSASRMSTIESLQESLVLPLGPIRKRKRADDSVSISSTKSVSQLQLRSCSVVLEPLNHPIKRTKLNIKDEVIDVDDNEVKTTEETPDRATQSIFQSSDEDDDIPLYTYNKISKLKEDGDQFSVSSCDTTSIDLRTDEGELLASSSKSKKNKLKKSKRKNDLGDDCGEHHSSKREFLTFVDHDRGAILDIKVVGRQVLAASEAGVIYSYSIKSGKLRMTYKGHTAAVTCLCVVENDDELDPHYPGKLITGSLDDTVRCYMLKTGEQPYERITAGAAMSIDQKWDTIFIGTKLGQVVRINAKTFTTSGEYMRFSTEAILALKATKEGPRKVLIIGSRNQAISVRDADTGLLLRSVSGDFQNTVYSLLLHRGLVYCGTTNGTVPVFDFTNGNQMHKFTAGVGVRCIKIYNGLLFAGCYDGFIYIFNIKTQLLITKVTGSGKMILCLDIAKGKIIFSCKNTFQALNFPPDVCQVLKNAKSSK